MVLSDIFMPIITIVTAQITVLELAQFRFKPKKLMLILALELLIQVTISAPVLIFAGLDQYASYFFFTIDLPAILTFWYISKRRDFRDLFTVMITIFISFAISIPSMWVAQLIHRGYLWYNVCRILIFLILLLFLHFIVRKHYIRLQEELEKGWGVFSILPLIGSAFLYYQYWNYSMKGGFLSVIMNCTVIILTMTMVFMVFFYVFKQLHEKYIVQEQKRLLDMQNKAQHAQFEQQREAAEISNRRWHDMRHNTQELIELLESGNTEAALAYLIDQRGMPDIPREAYCLHPAVNSILCLWAERCRKANIKFDIRTDVPEKLEIEPMELTSLFANAFENAYEGCLRLSSDQQKYITLEAHYNGKRLAIGFTNPCLKDLQFEEGMPVSSKKGGGIGTRSIVFTVKRFRGAAYFDAKDGTFTTRFILNV